MTVDESPIAWPEPACVTDAVLGPLVASGRPGRIACLADTEGASLEHLRERAPDGPFDALDVRPIDPAASVDAPLVSPPAIYAGPYLDHFGHMLAEGMHRLWAASVIPHLRNAMVAFQLAEADAPASRPWFAEVLALCGVAPERVVLVDRPMRFATLYLPKQGRILSGETMFPDYPRLFPLTPIARASGPASARVYVSRSRHIHTGSYLGESLVEEILARDAGFDILHPQELPTAELLARLAAAELMVFAEGSAIHNLELLGRVQARVLVIGRRGGTERHFGGVLRALCREWRILPGRRPAACLDWESDHAPRHGRGCSFTDLPWLIGEIARFTGIDLRAPERPAIDQAVTADLLRFLLDPRSGVTSDDARLGRALRLMRENPEVVALRVLSADMDGGTGF